MSFSVDSRDTPAELEGFKRVQKADWTFLSGKKGEVAELAIKGFRVGAIGEFKKIAHSKNLVLIDKNRRIRGWYDGQDDKAIALLGRHAKYLSGR